MAEQLREKFMSDDPERDESYNGIENFRYSNLAIIRRAARKARSENRELKTEDYSTEIREVIAKIKLEP